jgi:hypothetical protein
MPDNKLDSAQIPMIRALQEAIDRFPPGPERDYHQACFDRFVAKLNGLPERVAAKLHMKADHDNVTDLPARQEVIRILTKGMQEHLGGNPAAARRKPPSTRH